MRYVLTAEQMKGFDQWTIEQLGIPSLVLMERAALAMKEELERVFLKRKSFVSFSGLKVLIAAGTGNNGGDGLALGRLLFLEGAGVDVYFPGSRQRMSKECERQAQILEKLGLRLQEHIPGEKYDIVLDCLFGIGLTRDICGVYREAVEQIGKLKERGAFVCAADIPSGICADTGKVLGCAVRADLTVTFAFAKRGQLYDPGRQYVGRLAIKDIGIVDGKNKEESKQPLAFCYDEADIGLLLPRRKKDGNKGTFGKVFAAAGSRDMAGACILCGEAVLRTGAGMVKIMTPACNRRIVQSALPEAMLYSYEKPAEEKIRLSAEWADVVIAGPGMGTGEAAYQALKMILSCVCGREDKALVLDADALNLLAAHQELGELVKNRKGGPVVLTPHPGELVRLLGKTMEEYQRDREEMTRMLAREFACTVAGKDAVTLVASKDSRSALYINTSGCDGMATAGSGDVLCGVIGALLAQGMEAFNAACLGVFAHGAAGLRAAEKRSAYAMKASDLIKELCGILAEYSERP